MELRFIVLTLLFLAVRPNFSASSTTSDCINSGSPESNSIHVQVYDAADEVQNFDHNGTVVLQIPSSTVETFGWIGLECRHSKPVRWVYDLNFIQEGLGDTYSQTSREFGDFYNSSSYIFKADIELKVHRSKLNFVLFCATFDNICERKVAHAYYDKTRKRYILKLLQESEENMTLVTELERAAVQRQNWLQKPSHNASCAVNFSMVDRDESFSYSFYPTGNTDNPRPLPDRQNLENTYLFHEKLSPKCFIKDCENCIDSPKLEVSKYWPLVIFFPRKNASRVVHPYHTIITRYRNGTTGPGKLKLEWERSNKQDFIVMDLFNDRSADNFYMGEYISINCYTSPYLFSSGTQIAFGFGALSRDKTMSFLRVMEESNLVGFGRLARGEIALEWPDNREAYNMTVVCFAPVWNSSTEWVNISKTVEINVPSLQINGTRKIVTVPIDTDSSFVNVSCTASGPPAPDIQVTAPGNNPRINVRKTTFNDTTRAEITIARVDGTHVGVYNCVATNAYGVDFFEFEIKDKHRKAKSDFVLIVLSSIFVPVIVIFLAIVIILAVKFRMEKEEFRRLTEEAVRDFLEGMDPSLVPRDEESSEGHLYANDSLKTLPYNDRYEIPHKNWSFGNTLLGSGNFGIVIKGTVEIGSRKSMIAIKTIKSPEDFVDFKATLLELKIHAHIGHHHHIVKLIAASTEEIHKRKVLIGVEFCANGSLLTYMQKRKRLFTNNVHDGQINFPPKQESSELVDGLYDNLITSDISTVDLYKWAFQIACGMNFLESKKVLHADLATRNILLTEDLVVKISDFGLSRDLFENSEYTKKTQVALPWKWMAIESLKYLKFSLKSDVWSYGVTLYEVFTLGGDPYSGQTWSEEFVALLENGMRLERPMFCTNNVYNRVMMQSWQKEPSERISFGDAMSFFEKAIGLLTSSARNDDECRELC